MSRSSRLADVLSSIVMMAGLIAFAIWSMWFSGFAI